MRWHPNSLLRGFLHLAPVAALAATPKCALCLAAYLGMGEALGLKTRELCGGPGDSANVTLVAALPLLATAAWLLMSLRGSPRFRRAVRNGR